MTRYYVSHYFDFKNIGIFLLVSLIGLITVLAIVLFTAKLQVHRRLNYEGLDECDVAEITRRHRFREIGMIESFYEMTFSSTSVLLFLSLYYIIDARIPQAFFYWSKYQDFILLLFLILSVFFTGWLDRFLVPLEYLPPDQKSSVRLVSSFYIILILMYIKFIYDDSNYDALILYFVSLAIGRFVYFDFTAEDFISTISKLLKNLYLLILMGCYSGFVCWFGFHVKRRDRQHTARPSVYGCLDLCTRQNPSDPVCPLKKTDITKDTKRSPVKSMAVNSLQGISVLCYFI